ncbi:hypothetical protein GMD88_12050 [Pseudoflavonifractor sp. BIOML-A6]|jgi:hypothetical protein|nr:MULTISPECIES: hypothetical protein [unclassified Pseudoflavonifractor]MTQ95639.1 hypothetical protein [Pseudoflavonifractor sp. BIOML-A16]MTR06021.1 hypothetical protein [Pseudoflavonifractor sp. BIOML-A15]MTR32103.1 hypothetical protein [Pseudoflavonifractor sp. BIOML-A14]MTR73063.1 hypothetical protein [Pseudoflavonifractor sp. BIOML-A18]MTS63714.1 hypothetical protein [Pseudoflavonifractor sp. BIOML-A5]MTS71332.1 hypothetical protein [Pseudoflavonifractor sp. BIOML-A8]MTS91565.1 hypoth
MAKSAEILVYITADRERVVSGDPLTLFITDEAEVQRTLTDLGRALKADAVRLSNGDHILISG